MACHLWHHWDCCGFDARNFVVSTYETPIWFEVKWLHVPTSLASHMRWICWMVFEVLLPTSLEVPSTTKVQPCDACWINAYITIARSHGSWQGYQHGGRACVSLPSSNGYPWSEDLTWSQFSSLTLSIAIHLSLKNVGTNATCCSLAPLTSNMQVLMTLTVEPNELEEDGGGYGKVFVRL